MKMNIFFSLIFILLSVGSHVASKEINCKNATCSLFKEDEINITADSFPRNVQSIIISKINTLSIDSNSISSLEFLDYIKITNVKTLILQNRSLSLANESKKIFVDIYRVTDLQMHSDIFENWGVLSKITIRKVKNCSLLSFSVSNTRLFSIIFRNMRSMIVHENSFSNSTIEIVHMVHIKSLSIMKQAFTSNAILEYLWIERIRNLTIHSNALSEDSKMNEFNIKKVKYLDIESNGIEADISVMWVKYVAIEICNNNTFGNGIEYMTLKSSYIHQMKKNCISGVADVNIKNNQIDNIETSGISGDIVFLRIKSSNFGKIANNGLDLNVTRFYIEDSTIVEASEKAFTVYAYKDIIINNCTIDVLQKGAFETLNADRKVFISNLHIKNPQKGSLQFNQNQKIKMYDFTLDIPCTCDMVSSLGLNVSFWSKQPLCIKRELRPSLDFYLKTFCSDQSTKQSNSEQSNLETEENQLSPETKELISNNDSNDQGLSGPTKFFIVISVFVLGIIGVFFAYRYLKRKGYVICWSRVPTDISM